MDSQSLDVSDIAENVMPSVVAITIKAVTEYDFGVFGGTYEYESEGSGSGIIIDTNESELLMVTNNHVVSGAETVSVCFIDGAVYEANVKGTDVDNDLAVISVDLKDISDETMNSIKIATIGNSDELKVGEQVVAIGNALGYGQSVTTGIISAKDRIVSTNTTPLIQTDAAINPGNSGGALLNMSGEVIGINSSKYASTEVEGMGYAIPISAVESILEELMNQETKEKVPEERRGYLGISCQTIDSTTATIYNVPAGAYITEFSDKSAAEAAGMELESIIVKFDGQSISSAEELVALLEYYEKGTEVEVVAMIDDNGEYIEKTYNVILGKQPESEE
ncbi:MAG: trypsin-like serine protease [Lachnospiraceae bacterium]|nr:trypsin-like serine protease [Lachnospiraceae bacterium]